MPIGYILSRSAQLLPIIFIAVTINFMIPRLIPGDPASTIFAASRGQMRPEQLAQIKQALGLSDDPMIIQYFTYLSHVLRFDFGISFSSFPAPVTSVIGSSRVLMSE